MKLINIPLGSPNDTETENSRGDIVVEDYSNKYSVSDNNFVNYDGVEDYSNYDNGSDGNDVIDNGKYHLGVDDDITVGC